MTRWVPALIAIVVCLTLLAGCGTNYKTGFAGSRGGIELERGLWDDIKAKHWPELRRHLAPTFTWVSASAAAGRTNSIDELKRWEIEEYSIGDVRMEPNGADVVISYTMTWRASANGQPLPTAMRMMTVWQEVGTNWIAIAHSEQPAEAVPAKSATPATQQMN